MHGALWIVLVVTLLVWIAGWLFDIGGRSIHGLLAVVIVVLCYTLIARRTSCEPRK